MSHPENDKFYDNLADITADGVSSCCSAKVYLDICADCKEHCEVVNEED